MPRKTSTCRSSSMSWAPCFNEAAARCRGKPVQVHPPAPSQSGASMRPRPDAAENATAGSGFRLLIPASMRPRPDAAENLHPLP